VKASTEDFRALNRGLHRLVDSFRRGFSQVTDPVAYGILHLLADGGLIRPTELATALDVIPSSVTRALQALADDGLIRIDANPNDGRSSLVAITATGRDELRQFDEVGVAVSGRVLADWNQPDVQQLTSLLQRLIDDWEREAARHSRPGRLGSRRSRGN
jgi:DNA-binding MarR family transcriptional regulator